MYVDQLCHFLTLTDISKDILVSAHLKEVYCRLGWRRKILSDSGSEFKNSLISDVATELGIKHSFSSPYRPKANGLIEASHNFLKNCVRIFTMQDEVE